MVFGRRRVRKCPCHSCIHSNGPPSDLLFTQLTMTDLHVNHETGESSQNRSPRFTLWVAFLIFATITLGAAVEVVSRVPCSGMIERMTLPDRQRMVWKVLSSRMQLLWYDPIERRGDSGSLSDRGSQTAPCWTRLFHSYLSVTTVRFLRP